MADHPTVTTPGGTDIFAGLESMDYSTFNDESMAMLVNNNLAGTQTPLQSASRLHNGAGANTNGSGATPTALKSGLTPGGGDPFLMTPRTAGFMAELAAPTPSNGANGAAHGDAGASMLFDHELVTSGNGGGVLGNEDDDEDGDALRQDDLPTPLTFSFTPTGGAGGPNSTGSMGMMGARYHVAAAHKHKRVRSNPDMLQNLSFQQLLGNSGASPLRPSVESQSMPTTPMDGNGAVALNADGSMPEPLPISIGTVNVQTPVGFHGSVSPIRGGGNGEEDAFPSDMDSFLKDVQWSELAENNNSMNVDTLSSLGGAQSAGYLSQRIQAGMNELKMKRKRPTQHMRHHSNPVDLLHNLDQFRLLSQQQQPNNGQQAQHVSPPHSPPMQQFPSPTKLDDMGMGMGMGMQQPLMQPHMQAGMQQPMMMAPNPYAMGPPQQDMQFQVPSQIANGQARSLHSRRSSMPNSAFARGARGRAPRGSTGLSMDMSQMNLDFLSLPEDQFQQKLHEQQVFQQAMGGAGMGGMVMGGSGVFPSPPSSPPLHMQQQNSPPQRGGGGKQFMTAAAAAAAAAEESNRKSYKCGRCGKPKVGHVCTMPDLRNNWSQVDLEVTKGTKVLRTNCHIVATKNKWVTQHEDNL